MGELIWLFYFLGGGIGAVPCEEAGKEAEEPVLASRIGCVVSPPSSTRGSTLELAGPYIPDSLYSSQDVGSGCCILEMTCNLHLIMIAKEEAKSK